MKRRGFPGCFASWDCKHYFWKNCPVRLAGSHKGKEKGKTLVMEAICDPELYMWYIHFGEPGSLNDINILDRSTIVGAILAQTMNTQVEPYLINGQRRDWLYFLADGIYPPWSIFAKTNPSPTTQIEIKYAKRHEYVRKDIERCFGVLISKYQILANPIRLWYMNDINAIMQCCVILHNMTIEMRRDSFIFNDLQDVEDEDINVDEHAVVSTLFEFEEVIDGEIVDLTDRVANMATNIEDAQRHTLLANDLAEHINSSF